MSEQTSACLCIECTAHNPAHVDHYANATDAPECVCPLCTVHRATDAPEERAGYDPASYYLHP